jgi:hypothetical protein
MSFKDELVRRGREYARRHDLVLGEELGFGVHGIVFVAESQPKKGRAEAKSAVKVHQREPDYCRERDVYLRLKEHGVSAIRGCHVPQLLRYDDQLWIIEMTVVSPSFSISRALSSTKLQISQKRSGRIGKPRSRSNLAHGGRKLKRFFGTCKAMASMCLMFRQATSLCPSDLTQPVM